MQLSVWTAKAGSGATTVCLGIATRLAEQRVLLVDLSGDLPAAAGLSEPSHGVTEWLRSVESGPDALARLELDVARGIDLLPLGCGRRWSERRSDLLCGVLSQDDRAVIVDLGVLDPWSTAPLDRLRMRMASEGEHSLLVTRACYLSVRRACRLPVSPSGVVLLQEAGRSLGHHELEAILGAPVVARIDVDSAVARAIDSGLVLSRAPRLFSRQLKGVA